MNYNAIHSKKETSDYFEENFTEKEKSLLISAAQNYAKSEEVVNGDVLDPLEFLRSGYWLKWIKPEGRA